jgi:stage II sporulation protein D
VAVRAPGRARRIVESVRLGGNGTSVRLVVEGRQRIERAVDGPVTITSDGRRLRLVAEVDLERLVASVVAAELENESEAAALEAAAVAIRSYIVASPGRHARDGFDVCDTTHCLVSKGVPPPTAAGRAAEAAAAATRGLVLASGRRLVAGYYTACCGGGTTTPNRVWGGRGPELYEPVACDLCADSPYFRWSREAAVAGLHAAVEPLVGWRLRPDAEIRVTADAGGWVRRVAIRSGSREAVETGERFRLAVGRRLGWETLPSSRFEVERRGPVVTFRGRGFGHGVGLCLAGALARARAGESRDAILRAYFPKALPTALP